MLTSSARLSLAVFLSSFCFFLAVPLVPLYVAELGRGHASLGLSGATIAISFLLSAALSPLWGKLAQRYGPRPMMLRASALASLAYAATAFAPNLETLFAARCLAGVASGFVPVATTALISASADERRARDMGWLSAAKSAGALLGPALGGVLVWSTGSFAAAFAVAAAMSLGTLAVAFSVPGQAPPAGTQRGSSDVGPQAGTPVVTLGLVGTGALAGAGMFASLWLPLAAARGQDGTSAAGSVGIVMALASGAAMLAAPRWGSLADRRPRGQVLLATVLLPIPVLVVMAVIAGTSGSIAGLTVLVIGVLFVAATVLGSEALAILGAEVSCRLPPVSVGSYFGWSNTWTQLASGGVALVAPAVFAWHAALPISLACALYLLAAAVLLRLVPHLRLGAARHGTDVEHVR